METLWSTIGPGALAPVLAWLATYVVHSTLLLGGAWGTAAWLRRRRRPGALALEERLWKAALLGGLLTAGLQVGLGALPHPLVAAVPGHALLGTAAPHPAPAGATAQALGAPLAARTGTARAASRPDPRLVSPAALLPGWQRLALAAWLLGALALSAALAASWIRLRLTLRRRHEVGTGPARLALERLLARSGTRRVRLTGTTRLPVPVALGVGEREICLPLRALAELDDAQQEGLVAHELAHLERRDPAWLLAGRALENLLFLQPLNRLARRRLQEISEYRSDAWAVAATGDRVGLARCLTEVAAWLSEGRQAAPVPGMARTRRNLGERVRRILEPAEDPGDDRRSRRLAIGAAAAALALTVLLAPGMSPTSLALEAPPAAPPAPATAAGKPPAAPTSEEVAKAGRQGEHAARQAQEEAPEADRDLDRDLDLDGDLDGDLAGAFDPAELAAAIARIRATVPDPEVLADIERQVRAAVEQVEANQSALAEARRLAGREAQEQIRTELDQARREMERTTRQLHEETRRQTLAAQQELRRQAERQVEEARRQLEAERRELERQRDELERERRALEKERERLRRERGEAHETSPPPSS